LALPKSICVFCGSRRGHREEYAQAARKLGAILAENEVALVYGGGGIGLMGEVANAALERGGHVTGIMPDFLRDVEPPSYSVSEFVLTANMHERKAEMYERSDAFCVLPGGIGTLEEAVEMVSWAYLKRHAKPIVFVDINGYWDSLLQLVDFIVDEGFAPKEMSGHWEVVSSVDDVLPTIDGWLDRNKDEPDPKF
jgi:uncharacterized protein (TIGR00730 family)